MKLDRSEEIQAETDEGGAMSPSRRKFLRTSSATALVTSLASQPVWGQCTVSGGISGGSRTEETTACLIPPGIAGRSPGFWSAAIYGGQNGVGNALAAAFPSVERSRKEDLRCHIINVFAANTFTIPATDFSPEEVWTVAEALNSPGGYKFNLAGIWADAYFGFFGNLPAPERSSDPQDWVEHFFALYMIGASWGDAVFNAVFMEDATTSWSELPAEVSCTS